MNLAPRLRDRETPVRVGFVGAGIFGSQVIHAVEATPGMETAAIADVALEKAHTTFRRTGVAADDVEEVATGADLDAAVDEGTRAVTRDGDAVVEADLDVVVDATGNPNVAARNAFKTLLSGTPFVNVSVEADTVCGRLLAVLAESNDTTYTLVSGDQPGQIVGLCDWAETVGFEVVAAGKASREPEPYGTPEDSIERHGRIVSFGGGIDPDPKIYNTFLDGTKMAVESVASANALGLPIDTRGMHHPTLPVAEMPAVLRPEADGGVLSRAGVIDTVTSEDVGFSVFVVTRTESAQLREYYAGRPNIVTSPDGAYQLFYRPYHFAPETTVSIARAALLDEATGAPRTHLAEVVAAAKRDLAPGDELDGGGGYTIYGVAADADRAAEDDLVPFELLEGAEVVRPVERDGFVGYDDVELDTDQPLYHLRALQDDL